MPLVPLLLQTTLLALCLLVPEVGLRFDGQGKAAAATWQAEVKDDGNNLRQAGGEGYRQAPVIGVLNRGDRVVVHRQQGTWSEVTAPDGLRGWVHSACLSPALAAGDPAKPAANRAICPPDLPRRFSADLDGDGRQEKVALEQIPNNQGGDASLVVRNSQGAILWRGPTGDNPLTFFCRDWGIYWPGIVGDVDDDGAIELLAQQPQSDVSPSSFMLARWTGQGFAVVSQGWSLLEQPAGSGRFVSARYVYDGKPVVWIMNFLSLEPGGQLRASVYQSDGSTVRTGVALARLTSQGARLEKWLDPLH